MEDDFLIFFSGVDFSRQPAVPAAPPMTRSQVKASAAVSMPTPDEEEAVTADFDATAGEDDEFKDDFDCFNAEWTDAKDFFCTPGKNRMFANVLADSAAAGCKRSSIIKIREKGIVSRNVETFANNPKMPTAQTASVPQSGTF